jgi:hypothetical protein
MRIYPTGFFFYRLEEYASFIPWKACFHWNIMLRVAVFRTPIKQMLCIIIFSISRFTLTFMYCSNKSLPAKVNHTEDTVSYCKSQNWFFPLLAVFAWTFAIPKTSGSHTSSPFTSKNATVSRDYHSRKTTQQKYLCILPGSTFCIFLNDFHTADGFWENITWYEVHVKENYCTGLHMRRRQI